MNKNLFPWIASGAGLILVSVLFFAGAMSPSGEYSLPLLMMLFMSELGVLVTGAGAYVGAQIWLRQRSNTTALLAATACTALALGLLWLGLTLWYGNQPG